MKLVNFFGGLRIRFLNLLMAGIFVFAFVSGVDAVGIIYVATTGNDTTGDGSQANRYRTIQKGIDSAVAGDTVLVADGTYIGTGNVNLDFGGKAITVKSENGPANCIIDCEGKAGTRGFYFHNSETSASVVDGFTIRNGYASPYEGSGIYCANSSPTIKNNIITGNRANLGSGIYCYDNSSPTITNNTITGNTAFISGDSSGNGGGIYCSSSSPTITNNTITGNSASYGGGIYCSSFSAPLTITNTILWNNSPEEIRLSPDVPSTVTISYSDIRGGLDGIVTNNGTVNWDDETNINADPLFVNDDYHLSDCSPCIGAGIMTTYVPDKDIEGNTRPYPLGSNPDMGAYENSRGEPKVVAVDDAYSVDEDTTI